MLSSPTHWQTHIPRGAFAVHVVPMGQLPTHTGKTPAHPSSVVLVDVLVEVLVEVIEVDVVDRKSVV